MKPREFVQAYQAYAVEVEQTDGVPALFSLAQSALESGWGETVVGNMMFGVKDTDGINGNEQLVTTTEYHNSPNVKYPHIFWIKEIVTGKRWQYRVKDWFRKYPTPADSFRDHARFLKQNKRYAAAFNYCASPYDFAREVCRAGYATDPNYQASLLAVMATVERALKP